MHNRKGIRRLLKGTRIRSCGGSWPPTSWREIAPSRKRISISYLYTLNFIAFLSIYFLFCYVCYRLHAHQAKPLINLLSFLAIRPVRSHPFLSFNQFYYNTYLGCFSIKIHLYFLEAFVAEFFFFHSSLGISVF